ncbi:MAG: hypothetical protein N3F09_02865 [Bacteroidia bacterium]|nr:hypothetical protein [Bacteroidia bacterium]
MSPQYKSVTLVFPIRQFSVSKLLIEQNVGNQEDYMLLGDEDDAEKILEIMNSDAMKMEIFNRFNLWDRWKIKKDTEKSLFYMKNKWKNQVQIKKTVYNVIKIEVWDYTSAGAAELSHAIAMYTDTLRFRMIKPVAEHALNIVREEYENTIKEMNLIEDTLQKLRKLGILEYKAQAEAYAKSYAKSLEKNDRAAMERIKAEMQKLEQYGGLYLHLSENLRKYRFKFPVIKSKYDEAKVNARRILPAVFVLQKSIRDEFPDRPKRFLLALAGMMGSLGILLFYFMLKNKNQKAYE